MADMETVEFMDRETSFKAAKALVVPVPFSSTRHTKGCEKAPREILQSFDMEEYDIELGYSPNSVGIYPLPEKNFDRTKIEEAIEGITEIAKTTKGKFPVFLGGDHSVAIGTTAAFGDVTVISLDAHADLRDTYGGSKYSNGCVMRRISEKNRIMQFGIRTVAEEEREVIKKHEVYANVTPRELESALSKAGDDIYLTVDVDVLDSSIMPATNYIEPGGLGWKELLGVIMIIFQKKNVVGCDICELSPIPGFNAPNVLCAHLAYKMIGYKFAKQRQKD